MLYTYECPQHGEFDISMPVDDMVEEFECPHCNRMAKKIITLGHGGIMCDSGVEIPWLASACNNLLPDGHKPIESRSEYKRYLKQHNIMERG